MHIREVLILFAGLFFVLVAGQRGVCEGLERRCQNCSGRLGNENDRTMPHFNRQCMAKTRRAWIWREVTRCELLKLNCEGRDRKMNCNDVAQLAGMRRIRN